MSSRKRPVPQSVVSSQGVKRRAVASSIRTSTGRGRPTQMKIKRDPDGGGEHMSDDSNIQQQLQAEFIALFDDPVYKDGVSNSALKSKFGESKYLHLVGILNNLSKESKLNISRLGDELFYELVSDELATKLSGLDESSRMVYQFIERAGNLGIWTKDIKTRTNIHQQTLNKIIKSLESRKLVKPVKAVNSKTKNLYMLYHLTPAEEITGGPWYTDQQFDHEFINGLRTFILMCVKKLNGGKGVTLTQISEKMKRANISRVPLDLDKVQQLVQTLAFDYLIEQSGVNPINNEALFVSAKRVSTMCDFKSWEVIDPDFQFRRIKYEDGVTLDAHEHHHHSSA